MKTIKQALIDDIHYPCSVGFIENRIVFRGLDAEGEYNQEIAHSKAYIGAIADCLYSLISAPNFAESDKTFSLSNRDLILKKANALYRSIGEDEVEVVEKPMVYIGEAAWQ